jgi:hypothetical protein
MSLAGPGGSDMMMPCVEGIEVLSSPLEGESLWGAAIEVPETGDETAVHALRIEGWALGKAAPIEAIEVLERGVVLQHLLLDQPRPEVAVQFPQVAGADRCGFRALLSMLGLPQRFELELVARLTGTEQLVPLGTIRAQRRPLRPHPGTRLPLLVHGALRAMHLPLPSPRLQPLIMTSLGRSGSSWTMYLLGLHPQLVTYEPTSCEPRVTSYWLQVAKTICRPTSYLQTVGAVFADEYWWLGRIDNAPVRSVPDEELEIWLGRDAVEEIVAFSQTMIDEFYTRAAKLSNKQSAVYFAEKFAPQHNETIDLVWEIYSHPKEIILIRDFRDVFCSILAFNQKRGFVTFGRERVDSDEEFVLVMKRMATRLLRAWRNRSDRAHLVRYEDLVLNGREAVSDLLAYLGVDNSPTVIDEMTEGMTVRMAHQVSHCTSVDARASIGRWRRDLTPSLQAACQIELGDLLSEFGYDIE